jgi:hypothetical protein
MLKDKGAFIRHLENAMDRLTRMTVYITHLLEGQGSTGTAQIRVHAIGIIGVYA